MLRIIGDAPSFVPNAVIICDLQVLSVRQEVRNCSVTYRQRLNGHPNNLSKSVFQRPNYNRRLKRYYPADLAARFNWYSATPLQTIPNHLWLSLNRRCITGCIAYMTFRVTVNTTAECLRTDCNILGDKIWKKLVINQLVGTAVGQWLRYCVTSREVAGSIPDCVIGIFPSDRTMALGSTQTLTEMSTRSISCE